MSRGQPTVVPRLYRVTAGETTRRSISPLRSGHPVACYALPQGAGVWAGFRRRVRRERAYCEILRGCPLPPAAAPSGVVTFLFTDVEGSTRRWEADADGMRAALAAHDEVLRAAIEAHGGWLFKHTGDGVCAAFASPRSAVDAAVAAQRALELPVRMGLATGEAELREADYFGAVLESGRAGDGRRARRSDPLAESTAGLLSGVDLVDLGRAGCGTCRPR